MGQYLDLARGHRAKRVFDAHNAVWQLVRELAPRQSTPVHRLSAAVEWRRLRRFEGRLARESHLTLCVSERDRNALQKAAGGAFPSAIVPIGIEVHERSVVVPARTGRLLSIATMHYPPNADAVRWFLSHIWSLVAGTNPDAAVDVVGPRPPQDIETWPQRDSRITVHGYVEDVEPLYRGASMFIVPLLSGSGVRVKILEAMARGVPVVSTSIGADGLDVEHGVHLLIADTPEAFAAAVNDLQSHPERAARLAAAARERVLERYDWRTCCQPVLDAYRELSVASAVGSSHQASAAKAAAGDVTRLSPFASAGSGDLRAPGD
jgi:glycosyltransferase involved in cell wall biosynthesis